jgi:cytoskeletal protein CcmA (bactofilin family)
VFEGVIRGEGELIIEGVVQGDVHVGRLVVGENAGLEGTIHADTVEIRGRVVGNIFAKSVKFYDSAFVEGDVTHETLSIDSGAHYQGRCQQQRPVPKVVEAPKAVEAPKVVELDASRA